MHPCDTGGAAKATLVAVSACTHKILRPVFIRCRCQQSPARSHTRVHLSNTGTSSEVAVTQLLATSADGCACPAGNGSSPYTRGVCVCGTNSSLYPSCVTATIRTQPPEEPSRAKAWLTALMQNSRASCGDMLARQCLSMKPVM